VSTPTKIIPKSQHENFIYSFWVMMSECESKADNEDDRMLKHMVEGWFRQWNELNGTNLKPKWVTRKEQANLAKLVEAVDTSKSN
jgi:hypothetical protein